MADIVSNNPIVVIGTPDKVYDLVYISDLNIRTHGGENITAMVAFRYYRIVDGIKDYAPLDLGEKIIQIPDLNTILGSVEGGSDLKDAVESAFINIGKGMGVI